MSYIKCQSGGETLEFPLEDNNTLLVASINSQFDGNIKGLRYQPDDSESKRAVVLSDGAFSAPKDGWNTDTVYEVVFKKEEEEEVKPKSESTPSGRPPRPEEHADELIVLGLPYSTDLPTFRAYFEAFGPVSTVEIKKDFHTGKSRGFGFVRMTNLEDREKILDKVGHEIEGRRLDIKERKGCPNKIFVGRLAPGITDKHIRDYFQTFGVITDVYIPQPFRGFGFVTFNRSTPVMKILENENHTIEGVEVNVVSAEPKRGFGGADGGRGGGRGGFRGGRGGGDRDRGYDRDYGYDRGGYPPRGGDRGGYGRDRGYDRGGYDAYRGGGRDRDRDRDRDGRDGRDYEWGGYEKPSYYSQDAYGGAAAYQPPAASGAAASGYERMYDQQAAYYQQAQAQPAQSSLYQQQPSQAAAPAAKGAGGYYR